jgi:hypothetical protein
MALSSSRGSSESKKWRGRSRRKRGGGQSTPQAVHTARMQALTDVKRGNTPAYASTS